ncbi:heavy-metal-associated domain protein [bacterium BMS3Abin04]|nr:heavy-metal-associated domain protein [bacterium BMS3Abin04]
MLGFGEIFGYKLYKNQMTDIVVNKNKQMTTIEIEIKNITCSGCAGRIYRALSQYPGIIISSVNYKSNIVLVNFEGQKISGSKIN